MKKILFGILCLFLVALVPSVSAAVVDCTGITGTDLEVTDITFDPDSAAYEPGISVDVDIEVTNNGASPITLTASDVIEMYVYDNDGNLIDGVSYPMTFALATPLIIADGDSETIEDVPWIVDPSNYFAYNYNDEHNYVFYVRVLDDVPASATQCDVSDGNDVVIDNYPRVRNINSQTATEDSAFTYTAIGTDDDNELGEPVIDMLSFDLDDNSKAKGITIGSSTGIIQWTPRDEHVSPPSHTVIVEVSDGPAGGKDTETFAITVTNANDKPKLPILSDYIVQQDIAISDIILLSDDQATNVDDDLDSGDSISYSLQIIRLPDESTFAKGYYDPIATTKIISGWSGWDPITRTISGWIPDKDDVGELKLRLIATDSQSESATVDFIIDVYPKAMCEDAISPGDYLRDSNVEIEKPDSGDDFGPGDTINIKVTVSNDYAPNDIDVVIKAILYDVETQKKIADVESDDENIDEDGTEPFELELQIPLDSDQDYKGDYVLYIKAYEDGREDEQCFSKAVDVDIDRESHEVIIQSMTITPSTVDAGDKVDVLVRALNIGKKDEEGVKVRLMNADLDIDVTSDARDLGAYDESGNSYVFRFTDVVVSRDAKGKTHDLEAFVVFDEGAKSTSYLDSPSYRTTSDDIVVESEATAMIVVKTAEETAEGILRVPVKVTNTEGKTGLTVGLTNIDWAEDVEDKNIALGKGESTTVYFDLELSDDVDAGTKSFTVQLKSDGAVIDTSAKTLSISEDVVGGGFPWGTVLWIIGDIVLIVVAIFFIKLIFSARKGKGPKVREVKL